MSSYANWGNIIGTLVEDRCHQHARCNGKEGAKSASPILNLTAIISGKSKPDNLTIARMFYLEIFCWKLFHTFILFVCSQIAKNTNGSLVASLRNNSFSVLCKKKLSILYTFFLFIGLQRSCVAKIWCQISCRCAK